MNCNLSKHLNFLNQDTHTRTGENDRMTQCFREAVHPFRGPELNLCTLISAESLWEHTMILTDSLLHWLMALVINTTGYCHAGQKCKSAHQEMFLKDNNLCLRDNYCHLRSPSHAMHFNETEISQENFIFTVNWLCLKSWEKESNNTWEISTYLYF